MIKGFLNLPWLAWAAAAIGFRVFVIRWGHAWVWLLLAINFLLRGISPSWNGIADLGALAGGTIYLLFMLMSFVVK